MAIAEWPSYFPFAAASYVVVRPYGTQEAMSGTQSNATLGVFAGGKTKVLQVFCASCRRSPKTPERPEKCANSSAYPVARVFISARNRKRLASNGVGTIPSDSTLLLVNTSTKQSTDSFGRSQLFVSTNGMSLPTSNSVPPPAFPGGDAIELDAPALVVPSDGSRRYVHSAS